MFLVACIFSIPDRRDHITDAASAHLWRDAGSGACGQAREGNLGAPPLYGRDKPPTHSWSLSGNHQSTALGPFYHPEQKHREQKKTPFIHIPFYQRTNYVSTLVCLCLRMCVCVCGRYFLYIGLH